MNAPAAKRTPGRQTQYQLFHPSTGQCWWLYEGENSLGRALENDIIIRDESVSRRHARILVDGATIYIEDAHSVNGIWVGGERVKSAVLLRDAIFHVGHTELLVRKPTVHESGEAYSWMTGR